MLYLSVSITMLEIICIGSSILITATVIVAILAVMSPPKEYKGGSI